MATDLNGRIIKRESVPLDRLITDNYNPNENNVWDLVNVGFLLGKLSGLQTGVDADLLALFTLLSNAMGLKLISENVPLSGLAVFPNLPTYTPQAKERVLLIAQNNANENGLYEWQGGTLTRVWDWRDVSAGNGIAINGRNVGIVISPDSHPALRIDNNLLLLDPLLLGGGGGGGSIADIPNPDVDTVRKSMNQPAVFLPNLSNEVVVTGGNFRTANPNPAVLFCSAIDWVQYTLRKHNQILCLLKVNGQIGSHFLQVRNNSQSSNIYKDADHCITILGAAVIDTVSPRIKRNESTVITVTGEGFAFLSVFLANDPDITFTLNEFVSRDEIHLLVNVGNNVASGFYNLVCTNAFAGLGSFSSGASGNGKLEVYGNPTVTSVPLPAAELPLGNSGSFLVNGLDLTNSAVIYSGNQPNISTVAVTNITGSSSQKTVSYTVPNDTNLIGLHSILFSDIDGNDSGLTGFETIAVNYAYDINTLRIPAQFRAYGGAILSDWTFTPQADGVVITKLSGGPGGLEITDLFVVGSLLDYAVGGNGTRFNVEVLTPAGSLSVFDSIAVGFAPIGSNPTIDVLEYHYAAVVSRLHSGYKVNANASSVPFGLLNMRLTVLRRAFGSPNTSYRFLELNSGGTLGIDFDRHYASQTPLSVFLYMQDNYSVKISLAGWIGG